jgi:hypothetical protein
VAFAAYATQLGSIRSKQGRSAEVADLVARAAVDTPSLPALSNRVAGLSLLQSGDGREALLAHDMATAFEEYSYDITWLTAMSNCAATAVRLQNREAQLLDNRLAPCADHLAFTIWPSPSPLTRASLLDGLGSSPLCSAETRRRGQFPAGPGPTRAPAGTLLDRPSFVGLWTDRS